MDPSPLSSRRTAEERQRDRDLGFGAVVSRHRRHRLLNRDGTFNVVRSGLDLVETLAPHYLLRMEWPPFIGLITVGYLILNALFAALFLALGPDALKGPGASMLGDYRFVQTFFFSVETFVTISYGQLAPNGVTANALAETVAVVGMVYHAVATGLLFARFARPRPTIVFSDFAVIAPYGDGQAFEFRIANARSSEIIELEAQVLFSSFQPNGRGEMTRQFVPLPLERNSVVFFPLAWTIVHPIDQSSPFYGKTRNDLEQIGAEVLVLLSGIDETFEQTVHARSSYVPDEIVWGARFTSIFLPPEPDKPVSIDIGRIHEIEPVEPVSKI
jgi:inward rectifier potassium channel